MPTNATQPLADPTHPVAPNDASDLAAVIPWLPGPAPRPRPGLTDEDLERITAASGAARAPGTHRIYKYAWQQWATWCADRGFDPLPADPAAMCAFMTQRVADGLAVVSLGPFISVINYVHSAHGLPNPNESRAVRQVRDGLRRTYGVAPVRQAHPLTVAEIRTLVTGFDREHSRWRPGCRLHPARLRRGAPGRRTRSPRSRRHRTPPRRNRPADPPIQDRPRRPRRQGRRSARPSRRDRPRRSTSALVPVPRHRTGTSVRPASRRSHRSARTRLPHVRPPAQGPRDGGRPSQRRTSHRTRARAGHATEAHRAGVPIARIAAQTRHKDLSVLFNRYIRPVDALEYSSSKDLGL